MAFYFMENDTDYIELRCKAGETILDPDVEHKSVYYLVEGKAALQVFSGLDMPGLFIYFRAGDFIGTVEAFSNRRYPVARLFAVSDCVIQYCSCETLLERLERDPHLGVMMLRNCAEQMMEGDRWAILQNVASVLERTTISISKHYRDGTLEYVTKEQMANELCTQVRCLNRAIAELSDCVTYKKRFMVTDEQRLSERRKQIAEEIGLDFLT